MPWPLTNACCPAASKPIFPFSSEVLASTFLGGCCVVCAYAGRFVGDGVMVTVLLCDAHDSARCFLTRRIPQKNIKSYQNECTEDFTTCKLGIFFFVFSEVLIFT